jgi:serine/threonine protein kinase
MGACVGHPIQDLVIDEVLVMKRTQHRSILPLHAAFVDEHFLWMVMPFCAGGSLEMLLRSGYPKARRSACSRSLRSICPLRSMQACP